MNRRAAAVLAVVILILGAVALYVTRSGQPIAQRAPEPVALSAPGPTTEKPAAASPTPAPAPTVAATQAPVAEAAPPVAAPPAPPAKPAFAFRRLDIDTSKPAPEACLVFSAPLVADNTVRYDDFLRFTPAIKPAVRVSAERLCLVGIAYTQQVKVELREGLPAASGEKLQISETVPVELRDRAPLIAFRDGLILPRDGNGGVPVTTVNVDKLALKVLRVPDRLVSQLRPYELTQRQLYAYQLQEMENQKGSLVWSGELPVRAAKNESVTNTVPLRQLVPERRPGIYVIVARDAAKPDPADDSGDYDYDRQVAVQWVVDSDIGLTSFTGADGLTVFARSFNSAKPLAGVPIALIARNNDELARVTTDANGRASFAPGLMRGAGGGAPMTIMAYGAEGDFAFQDLTRSAFDLSDRGVDGREVAGPVDAFLYTDRGIYRPGETVHVAALLRDRVANAITQTPIVLKVLRPDGAEYRRFALADKSQGGFHLALPLTDTASRGRWQALAYLDAGANPVGRVEFDVDDFVPQRLKLTLTPPDGVLRPGDLAKVPAEARFLYGAPAAGLEGEAEMRVEVDPDPFPMHRGFRFGVADEKFQDQVVPMTVETTDEAGKTAADGKIAGLPDTTRMLRAEIRVAIFEPGGRSTDDRVTAKLRTRPVAIGVRPLFTGGRIQEDSEAGFEVIAVDETGARIERSGLVWELTQEISSYQWYRSDRGWRYERSTRDRTLEDGKLTLAADAMQTVKKALPWGYYRFTVSDPASGAATSVRFSAGWRGVLSEDRPDRAEVSADKDSYGAGETARIAIRPPTAGEALLVIANDRIFSSRLVSVPAEGTVVEVPVSAEWGAGAYAVISHFRPLNQDSGRAPVRSIGLAWLAVNPAPRTLGVTIGAPEKTLPRVDLTVPVKVANLPAGGKAWVTLAAVDEGILQLTKFQTPSPTNWYFGKRRLAVDIRDDYGRLIDAKSGVLAALRQGGDGLGGRGLEVVPTRTVALFSGLVETDAAGEAAIKFAIPDFMGELRLMAVAFDGERVGQGEGRLTVRDPVVSDTTFPRFLAPGDRSTLSLNLHNLDGAPGPYRAAWTTSGPAGISGPAEQSIELGAGMRQLVAFPIEASGTGVATFTLALTGPGGFVVERQWQIAVRAPQSPLTQQVVTQLAPGEERSIDRRLLDPYVPGTTRASLSLASYRAFDIAGLLQSLDRYPFGCLEQTTSRAFPLLFVNDLALLGGVAQDQSLERRVQGAIDRVLDMQTNDGDFGMWSSRSMSAYGWLSVYALDFLAQAKAKGYVVPDDALRRGTNFLRRVQSTDGADEITRAYAFYVLARSGIASAADLRQFHDTKKVQTAIGAGTLGAALVQIGDRSRASDTFANARRLVEGQQSTVGYPGDYYGSTLRDLAAVTLFAAEAGQSAMLPPLVERIGRIDLKTDYLTTQEKSWLLLAANALTRNRGQVAVTINGAAPARPADPVALAPAPADIANGLSVRNAGDKPLWQTVTVSGVPRAPLPAFGKDVTIERKWLKLDGSPADPTKLVQNERVIVQIRGKATDSVHHEFVLLDMLPAGWEIESMLRPVEDGKSPYEFLGTLKKTRVQEARDDRFVASFNTDGSRTRYRYWADDDNESPEFNVAYIVRAITPGTYVLPPAVVEDMYRPTVQARTTMGTVTVLAR